MIVFALENPVNPSFFPSLFHPSSRHSASIACLPPFIVDNVAVIVAIEILSSTFVRHQATACPIFSSSYATLVARHVSPLLFLVSLLSSLYLSILKLSRDVVHVRQRNRFLSNLEENVMVYSRTLIFR